MNQVSLKIKHAMLDNNLNNTELAQKLNTTRQNIGRILSSDDFKISTLESIANALNCDLQIEFIPKKDI